MDRIFLLAIIALVSFGLFIFLSASFGNLGRSDNYFSSVVVKQIVLGIVFGGLLSFLASSFRYKLLKRLALIIFIIAILLNLLVFVPNVGFSYGGATRWISFGSMTFQPSELLKIATVIYLAIWLSGIKDKINKPRFGIIPFLLIFLIVGTIFLSQPDTDSFVITLAASLSMFIAAGSRWKDMAIIFVIGIVGFGILLFARPYIYDRVLTFIDPARDPYGSGYQIQQSLIAVGSGGIFGRGFGQSIQKFGFLPEPIGDSIFAVAAEEFGFFGVSILLALYLLFGLRGLKIASRAPDTFGGLLVVGIVILILSQAFVNIASMIGIIPLSGITLPFISHGGTSMAITLAEVGIILNVSRRQRT